MTALEVVLIALALSFDAFAVSVATSAAGRVNGPRAVFRLSFHFGFFQFIMPVVGWLTGRTIEPLIAAFDHWIALGLLLFVGVRMLRSAGREAELSARDDPSRGLTLLTLAVATSIDALAVGLSMAMLQVSIWLPSIAIGVITATVSLIGIRLGGRIQARFGQRAEILGGIILIIIGLRIVVAHTILGGGG